MTNTTEALSNAVPPAEARSRRQFLRDTTLSGGELWVVERQPGWSDMENQLRNWLYYTWLSGDFIVEQFVHNLDIIRWVMNENPYHQEHAELIHSIRAGQRLMCPTTASLPGIWRTSL